MDATAESLGHYTRNPLDLEKIAASESPAAPEWIVQDWVAPGELILLSGRRGIGLTLLAHQLAYSMWVGATFIGPVPQPQPVLFWDTESDRSEVERRQRALNAHYGKSYHIQKTGMFIEALAQYECALVDAVISKLLRTDMHDELCKQVELYQANVVVLNGIDRLFGGNQADPHHRTEYIAAVKCALSRTGAAGIIVWSPETGRKQHPSGKAVPGGVWSGLCHAHLHFTAKAPDNLAGEVPDERDEGEPRTDLRYLFNLRTTRDARRVCTMVQDDGVYTVVAHNAVDNSVLYEHCKRIVINGYRKIKDMQIDTVAGKTSGDYLPKKIMEFELNEGLSMEDLAQMMRRLLSIGIFQIRPNARYRGNRLPRNILVLVAQTE